MRQEVQHRLMSSLYLIYTGMQRYASEVLKEQIDATEELITALNAIIEVKGKYKAKLKNSYKVKKFLRLKRI